MTIEESIYCMIKNLSETNSYHCEKCPYFIGYEANKYRICDHEQIAHLMAIDALRFMNKSINQNN